MPDAQDITTAIAVEVAKQIPVKDAYVDTLQPGAKQTGRMVEDLAKTLHLALAPLQFAAALQDRYRAFLDEAVRRVPEARRAIPPAQILGPVIEGIKYEPPGSPIEQMFSELLSSSLDTQKVQLAHPAFPQLIRQLSSDEAIMLKLIHQSLAAGRPYRRVAVHDLREERFYFKEIELEEFPLDRLRFPENLDFYINHLWTLGLAGSFEHRNQEPIFTGTAQRRRQVGSREFREYRITDLGGMLAKAAIPSPSGDSV
jgi:hypothetical protein